MASVIINNPVIQCIDDICNEFGEKLNSQQLNTDAALKEALADARARLETLLATPITREDKGQALIYSIKTLLADVVTIKESRQLCLQFIAALLEQADIAAAKGQALLEATKMLVDDKIAAPEEQQVYRQLIDNLLAQPDIQLVTDAQVPARDSVLYELVVRTQDYAAAEPLLTTYLARVTNPEAAILQRIANPANAAQTTDALSYCIKTSHISAIKQLLPYIVTPMQKDVCWIRLLTSKKESIIDTALTINWLTLEDKNRYLLQHAQLGKTATVELLLNKGATIEADTLHAVAWSGHTDTVKLLLDRGANIDQANQYGLTALCGATSKGHLDTVKLLLDRGARYQNEFFIAAEYGYGAIVELFLERRLATINQMNEREANALIIGAYRNHLDMVRLLLDRGATLDHEALRSAAANSNNAIIELFLARGADINHVGPSGHTALTLAATHNSVSDTIELLLNRGANIDHQDNNGNTALMQAASLVPVVIRKLLGTRDIQPQYDDAANLALIEANGGGHLDIVRLLLARGANVDIRNHNGQTALERAHSSCVSLLQEHINNLPARPRPR